MSRVGSVSFTACAVVLVFTFHAGADEGRVPSVVVARDGVPRLPIVAGSIAPPVAELKHYLDRIVGAEFKLAAVPAKQAAIRVGLVSDFPERKFDDTDGLGDDGFILATIDDSLYVVATTPLALRHGVATLLQQLGCRWFFPGEVWEVVPRKKNIVVAVNERQAPSFPTQRRIWYGYGAYGPCQKDWESWVRHNRMGGSLEVRIGHTWHGLQPERDFQQHPAWFALVDGRRQPTKPCYSHPDVIARAKQTALAAADRGEAMISMTPPDGLGYCTCDNCLRVAGVGEVFEEQGSAFGRRKDGKLVNVTSETVFRLVNEVARAVGARHPRVLIGCYAYSAYSHPPSFDLHPNVYVQTTTAYRRTPLTLEEQLQAFGDKTRQLGIREYYSVYQWDWDYPDAGKLTPRQLQRDLRFFRRAGVTAVNAEASNNWAPRGLGYYVASRLMWNVDADVNAVLKDFYEGAFGPAARVMQRYYVRWYGDSVAVFSDASQRPARRKYYDQGKHHLSVLRAAYDDLDEAAKLANDAPAILARIDHLRMYCHYLLLRFQLEQAETTGDADKILAAIGRETSFGGRLTYTNMIHTRPLLGKAFERRFRQHAPLLHDNLSLQQRVADWRRIAPPPGREELDRLWAADRRFFVSASDERDGSK